MPGTVTVINALMITTLDDIRLTHAIVRALQQNRQPAGSVAEGLVHRRRGVAPHFGHDHCSADI